MRLIASFEIPGDPVPQGRPRTAVNKQTGRAIIYDPSKSRDYKTRVGWHARLHAPAEPLEGPLVLSVKVYRSIPRSWSKKRQGLAATGQIRPTCKPDMDNYIKGIKDGMEGIMYANDSQVVQYGDTGKWYGRRPRVEIELWEWEAAKPE